MKGENTIVYSTDISGEIKWHYKNYVLAKEGTNKNAAFHEFISACERENKYFIAVIEILCNE